jgi:hypothetical protein
MSGLGKEVWAMRMLFEDAPYRSRWSTAQVRQLERNAQAWHIALQQCIEGQGSFEALEAEAGRVTAWLTHVHSYALALRDERARQLAAPESGG